MSSIEPRYDEINKMKASDEAEIYKADDVLLKLTKDEVLSFSFIKDSGSRSIIHIERAIHHASIVKDFSKSAICIGLWMIRQHGLYKDLGYKSFQQYIEADRETQLGLSKQRASEYANIGQILNEFGSDLVGYKIIHQVEGKLFDFRGNFSKLRYLNTAKKYAPSIEEVFVKMKALSTRQFSEYVSKLEKDSKKIPKATENTPSKIMYKGNNVYFDSQKVLEFDEAMPVEGQQSLVDFIKKYYAALDRGNVLEIIECDEFSRKKVRNTVREMLKD